MNKTDARRLEHAIDQIEQTIRKERVAFLELHRVKRNELEQLQNVLRELLETEAKLYRGKDLT